MGYTLPATVITDDEDAIALFQPSGAVCKRRLGRRGGPQGRSLLDWEGEFAELFQGWYVNLELPWRVR